MDIQIYGTKFTNKNTFGDFDFMCNNSVYNNSLFIFNDNEEHHNSCNAGGGNAIIRKYNKYNKTITKPKSAGIPTGTLRLGGYDDLIEEVVLFIDNSIQEIRELIIKYNYDTLYYSVGSNNKLGTGIFNVSPNVINYIDKQIHNLSNKPVIYI